MKERSKKFLALGLAMTMIMGTLSGCGQGVQKETNVSESTSAGQIVTSESASSESVQEEAKTVHLEVYFKEKQINSDLDKVEAAVNEYIEPLIGVTINMLGDQSSTPLDLALAAGDDIDLFWCQYGSGYNYIDDQIVYDITDLLKTEYKELYDLWPEEFWELSLYKGRHYFVPNYKEYAEGYSLQIPKKIVDKFGFDFSGVDELEDLEPFLKTMYDAGMTSSFIVNATKPESIDMDNFEFITQYMGIDPTGDTTKIVNYVESKQYRALLDTVYKWNQAGYINASEIKSGATYISGQYDTDMGGFHVWTTIPGDNDMSCSASWEREMVTFKFTENYVKTGSTFNSGWMVNARSSEEELNAALSFLQLLNTDDVLADLIIYGIEGEHYTRDESGKVIVKSDGGYVSSGKWSIAGMQTGSLTNGDSYNSNEEKMDDFNAFNATGIPTIALGFVFDPSEVEAEVAAISGAIKEYWKPLYRGFYDPDQYLPEFQKALKTAGIDEVIAEAQKQYDAWRAENVK